MIEGNTIGEAMYLSTHFGSDVWHVPRIKDNQLGGGALMDIGVYGVQLALWVFREEPIRISASAIMKNGKCPLNHLLSVDRIAKSGYNAFDSVRLFGCMCLQTSGRYHRAHIKLVQQSQNMVVLIVSGTFSLFLFL